MRKTLSMSRHANPGTVKYRQKRMCFSIFFCGCKLPKSFHISFSGAKIKRNSIRQERINNKCSFHKRISSFKIKKVRRYHIVALLTIVSILLTLENILILISSGSSSRHPSIYKKGTYRFVPEYALHSHCA